MEQLVNMLMLALLSVPQSPAPKAAVQIENWPALSITEHLVAAMPAGCGGSGTGCAVVNFSQRTCDVYIAWSEPQKSAVRERQMKRCRGYDEAPFRFRTAYSQWQASQPRKPGKKGDGGAVIATAVD